MINSIKNTLYAALFAGLLTASNVGAAGESPKRATAIPPRQNLEMIATNANSQNQEASLEAIKYALKAGESGGKITAEHKQSGASGFYQYIPSTARWLIQEARKEKISIPYTGELTDTSLKIALKSDPVLNNFLINYDLGKRMEAFDNNAELVLASHYAGEGRIRRMIREAYPKITDYSKVDLSKVQGFDTVPNPKMNKLTIRQYMQKMKARVEIYNSGKGVKLAYNK